MSYKRRQVEPGSKEVDWKRPLNFYSLPLFVAFVFKLVTKNKISQNVLGNFRVEANKMFFILRKFSSHRPHICSAIRQTKRVLKPSFPTPTTTSTHIKNCGKH